ncbi:MAG: hypothetical protein ABFS42_16570 [Candidatus Krumholzibacteriota bacterium]
MMTKRRICAGALLAVVFLAGCGGEPDNRSDNPAIRNLVDALVTAYGGEEAMARIDGYHAEGTIHATQWRINATTRRWFKRPDCLLLELDYPNRPEWRLTRGDKGWTGPTEGDWKPAGMPKIWPMRLQTVRFDLPLRLREHEVELILMQNDEKDRPVLRLTIDKGLHMEYHVDPASHCITTVMMVMDGPPAMVFQADYADFRMVEGVLFPHHEETWARGTMTSLIRIKSIEINPAGLDQRVAKPEKTTTDGMI